MGYAGLCEPTNPPKASCPDGQMTTGAAIGDEHHDDDGQNHRTPRVAGARTSCCSTTSLLVRAGRYSPLNDVWVGSANRSSSIEVSCDPSFLRGGIMNIRGWIAPSIAFVPIASVHCGGDDSR